MNLNRSSLFAALLAVGLAGGAVAQSTSQSKDTVRAQSATTTPAPPASGSTGMDKGAGTGTSAANAPASGRSATTDKSDKSATLSGGERRFLEEAARHGMAEVELGKMAQEKAAHPQVKEFGKRMVEDHGKANEELKKLAASKGVTLPTEMDRSHKRLVDKLAKKSGNDFDREYMDEMEDDHSKDVREFRSMAKNAKDADVKAFASSTLPTLEQHLQLAKSLEDDVKQAGRKNDRPSTAAGTTPGRSTATPGKDTSATTGTAGPGTGMPSNTARSTGSAPQAPGGPADARSTTSPSK
jgi:putative membrane protein